LFIDQELAVRLLRDLTIKMSSLTLPQNSVLNWVKVKSWNPNSSILHDADR